MLQRNIEQPRRGNGRSLWLRGEAPPPPKNEADVVFEVMRRLRRNVRLVAATALIGTMIALAAAFTITPQYRASVTLLVDPRQTKILEDAEVVGRAGTEAGAIESEVEMLQSPALMRKVAERLQLDQDDELNAPSGLVGSIRAIVRAPVRLIFGDRSEGDPYAGVVAALDRQTAARRRGLTYVIELTAWSRDSEKAARIANAFADSYLEDQLAAKAEATKQASAWLDKRVEELRQRVAASEHELEKYRAEAGLFQPGGQILSDQQVAQLNEQLVQARSLAAQARAKYEQLRQITPDQLHTAAASTDVLQSSVVSNLRVQYAETARQQAERSARYGPEHPLVTSGRAELANIEGQITDEIGRIVASARSEYEMAKSREASLEASLEDLKQQAARFNEAAIRQHELEREAQANRDLFQAVLNRARETAMLDLQVPDSRVISPATTPIAPSYPPKALLIGLGFFGSLGVGISLALARGAFDSGFMQPKDVEAELGMLPLASIPLVRLPTQKIALAHPSASERSKPLPNSKGTYSRTIPMPGGIWARRTLASIVIKQPDSDFAERIRSLRLTLSQQEADVDVLLVTSALPGEGKSTIAVNLAQTAAESGEHVLLVDADIRRPNIARLLELQGKAGLAGFLSGQERLSEAVHRDSRTGLFVIAGNLAVPGANALGMLSSKRMHQLIGMARANFDLVVIDSSPLLPVADTRALVDLVDGVAMVVASERTSREAVTAAILETSGIDEKLVGIVLNGVRDDVSRYGRSGDATDHFVAA